MTLKEIARKIPAEYRKEILDMNMITEAIAIGTDPSMSYLATIWKNYVSPDEQITCNLCLARIHENYKQLQPELIEAERQSRLLNCL